MTLFHITSATAWWAARATGEYRAQSLETDGFIHLSDGRQWLVTAQRFFKGQTGLVLLEIASEKLAAEVQHEAADGEVFPHLYGPLNLDAVVAAHDLPVCDTGEIGMPEALKLRRI